jgi:hypothetical protein
VGAGVTTVYRVAFYPQGDSPILEATITKPSELRALIGGIERDRQRTADGMWLDTLLFELLTSAATALREACGPEMLSDGQLLSIIGRALFTRFLVDRGIVKSQEIPAIASGVSRPESLFASAESTAQTFAWLDQTFNGDLLDLGTRDYLKLLNETGASKSAICRVLSNVMERSIDGQMSLDWGGLQFRHIPVDVLSQVYEHFAHHYNPETAHATSIHFTPRAIAHLLVDGAFSALPENQRATATVLDPAVGAGVFLVLAFRRIVAETWIASNQRPRRPQIRRILRRQLRGLDINRESIKVAALSLYLAALELDPEPQPLCDLKFEKLFDGTLICVDQQALGNSADAMLGSLSDSLAPQGPFDIVLGNPPWTGLPARLKPLMDKLPKVASIEATEASLCPNQWPDVGFMWKSLGWCKPGGVIALLVHARLLLSKEAIPVRRVWLKHARLTGVLNGMALRKERRIWSTNSQPFCALVALNRPPEPGEAFYFLTPRLEPGLGARGDFRLDPRSACEVPIEEAIQQASIFKTLARGTPLDVDLINRLRDSSRLNLEGTLAKLGVRMRQGFIVGDKSQSASFLRDYPLLEISDQPQFTVLTSTLPKMHERYPDPAFQWPREADIYEGPQLLFRQSPKPNPANRGAILVDGKVAFSRAFYGIRTEHLSEDDVNYLYVLSYSDVLLYWSLMTSSQFGVERDTFNADDFKTFPVPEFSNLSQALQDQCRQLRKQLEWGMAPWPEINAFCANVYRLSSYDIALVEDALRYELPYSESKTRAVRTVSSGSPAVGVFVVELKRILKNSGLHGATARAWDPAMPDPLWQFVQVGIGMNRIPTDDEVAVLLRVAAEPYMSSEIRLQLGSTDWLIGRLRQERYWSRTAARLLALDLLQSGVLAELAAA